MAGTETTAYHSSIAAGSVISTNPVAGTSVNTNSPVAYVVSLGRPLVPNVVGMTEPNAIAALNAVTLVAGTETTAYHSSIAAGSVISTNPVAGTSVNTNSPVAYVVSLGRPLVPNVVGMTEPNAIAALNAVTLVAGTETTAYHSSIAAGSVISTNPVAGTSVNTNSPVAYVVSLGRPLVPNVVGMTEPNAIAALNAVTLVAGTETTAYHSSIAAGSVISTNPVAGTSVNTNSPVAYVVSQGPDLGP